MGSRTRSIVATTWASSTNASAVVVPNMTTVDMVAAMLSSFTMGLLPLPASSSRVRGGPAPSSLSWYHWSSADDVDLLKDMIWEARRVRNSNEACR